MKETKCVFSSSKMVRISSSYCFVLVAQISAEIIMSNRNVTMLCVYLLYLVWTHEIGSDVDIYCLCVSRCKVPFFSINSWLEKGHPDLTPAPAYGQ